MWQKFINRESLIAGGADQIGDPTQVAPQIAMLEYVMLDISRTNPLAAYLIKLAVRCLEDRTSISLADVPRGLEH